MRGAIKNLLIFFQLDGPIDYVNRPWSNIVIRKIWQNVASCLTHYLCNFKSNVQKRNKELNHGTNLKIGL